MKQAVLTSPETITFSEIDKPVIKPNEILMKVKNIGICVSTLINRVELKSTIAN